MNLLNKCLSIGLLICCVSSLTACNTVEGAAQGARKDIKAVSNSMNDDSSKQHHN